MASMTDPAARDIPEDEDVAVGWSIQQVVAVRGLGRQRLWFPETRAAQDVTFFTNRGLQEDSSAGVCDETLHCLGDMLILGGGGKFVDIYPGSADL